MHLNKTQSIQFTIFLSIVITLLIWLSQLYLYNGWYFSDSIIKDVIILKYLGKITALITTILICWSFVLSANYKIFRLETKENQIALNKKVTAVAFYMMFLDPILLSLTRLYKPDSILSFFQFRPWTIGYNIGFNFGIIALLTIVFLTAVLKFQYTNNLISLFFRSFFGIIPFLILIHIYFLDGDIKKYPLLGIWIICWLILAIFSYIKPIFKTGEYVKLD